MTQSIITVDNVSKSYGGVKANVDISMTVKAGSITGIIGPNGCGKTTLFNSIVGYHPIDSGSIQFDGQEVSHLRVGEIARLGMLRTFSRPASIRRWTVSITCRYQSRIDPVQKRQCLPAGRVKSATGLNISSSL